MVRLATLILLGGLVLPVGQAVAGLVCEPRSAAHVRQHGGYAADSRWHVRHGERPTCQPEKQSRSGGSDGGSKDKKSRFCRKRWFC